MFRIILLLTVFLSSLVYSAADEQSKIDTILETYFYFVPKDQIKLTPLKEGYSNNSVFILEYDNAKYVLRIKEKSELIHIDKYRELFTFYDASKAGIAPRIYNFTKDALCIVMEYIPGGTLTTEQLQDPENILIIAQGIAKIHSLPKNEVIRQPQISRFTSGIDFILEKNLIRPADFQPIMDYAESLFAQLFYLDIQPATIHGDLNSRNIFLNDNKVLFIDWSETSWDDPFYDLSFFSLFNNLNEDQEMNLLTGYLGRAPDEPDLIHYDLTKQLNLAYLACSLILFSNRISIDRQLPLDPSSSFVDDWSYYVNSTGETTPQFYYNYARCALNRIHYKGADSVH